LRIREGVSDGFDIILLGEMTKDEQFIMRLAEQNTDDYDALEKENQELRRLLGMVQPGTVVDLRPAEGWTSFWAECEKALGK